MRRFRHVFTERLSFGLLANPAAIIGQIAAMLAVLTATRGYGAFGRGLRAVVSANAYLSEEDRGRAASLFRMLSKALILAAALTSLVSLAAGLSLMDDVERWGHALAAMVVSLILSLALVFIFELAVLTLKKRQTTDRISRRNRQ